MQGNFRSPHHFSEPSGQLIDGYCIAPPRRSSSTGDRRPPVQNAPRLPETRSSAAESARIGITPLRAQQREADQAWAAGHYPAARAGYQQVLATDPSSVRANLRLGILLSWEGKLDSAMVLLARARAADPRDVDTRLVQARVMAWNKQYADALLRYDSLLSERPDLREASLDRARALSWAGRLDEALDSYRALLAKDSADRDARFGSAQVNGWKGNLTEAERQYRDDPDPQLTRRGGTGGAGLRVSVARTGGSCGPAGGIRARHRLDP